MFSDNILAFIVRVLHTKTDTLSLSEIREIWNTRVSFDVARPASLDEPVTSKPTQGVFHISR